MVGATNKYKTKLSVVTLDSAPRVAYQIVGAVFRSIAINKPRESLGPPLPFVGDLSELVQIKYGFVAGHMAK